MFTSNFKYPYDSRIGSRAARFKNNIFNVSYFRRKDIPYWKLNLDFYMDSFYWWVSLKRIKFSSTFESKLTVISGFVKLLRSFLRKTFRGSNEDIFCALNYHSNPDERLCWYTKCKKIFWCPFIANRLNILMHKNLLDLKKSVINYSVILRQESCKF